MSFNDGFLLKVGRNSQIVLRLQARDISVDCIRHLVLLKVDLQPGFVPGQASCLGLISE